VHERRVGAQRGAQRARAGRSNVIVTGIGNQKSGQMVITVRAKKNKIRN
jgi:hypothetical protein